MTTFLCEEWWGGGIFMVSISGVPHGHLAFLWLWAQVLMLSHNHYSYFYIINNMHLKLLISQWYICMISFLVIWTEELWLGLEFNYVPFSLKCTIISLNSTYIILNWVFFFLMRLSSQFPYVYKYDHCYPHCLKANFEFSESSLSSSSLKSLCYHNLSILPFQYP